MAIQCASCQAENRDDAKFCDSCGAPMAPGATAENAGSPAKMNWAAIIIVLVIIAGLYWVLKPTPEPTPMTGSPSGANPHGGTEMGGTVPGAANPHASGGGGELDMENMMAQLETAKATLDEDPLHVESLITIYQAYGQIGMTEKIKPYKDAAVDALIAGEAGMDDDTFYDTLNAIAYSTLFGNVPEEGLELLDRVAAEVPGRPVSTAIKGNILFDIQRTDDAIAAYTDYLEATTPEEAGLRYWNAKSDRATMYLEKGNVEGSEDYKNTAIEEFTQITDGNPLFWSAWFNMGLAYLAVEQEPEAEIAFSRALDVSATDDERFRAGTELARLRGEEPPAPPAGMGGMGGMGGGMGGANPHGGSMGGSMGEAPEGTPNPHGGGMGGGMGSTPEGTPNPHGGSAEPDGDA